MHEILLCRIKKFGQGSIYNQQMSECIFVTNCSFENKIIIYVSKKKRS
jgi:hypothetical protein